nr:MAG: matrix protein [Bole Tick Virus 2]
MQYSWTKDLMSLFSNPLISIFRPILHEKNQQISITMWRFWRVKSPQPLPIPVEEEEEEDLFGQIPSAPRPKGLRALLQGWRARTRPTRPSVHARPDLWAHPLDDLPNTWTGLAVPNLPSEKPEHVTLDIAATLEVRAPRPLDQKTLAEMSLNFPLAYQGEARSKPLFSVLLAHLVSKASAHQTRSGLIYSASLTECVIFTGRKGFRPDNRLQTYQDTYEWRYKGQVFFWKLRFEAHPTVMKGIPLHQILSVEVMPLLRALGLHPHFRKEEQYLEIEGPQ